MKKIFTLSVMLILCMLTFATDFMRIKFKNYGCIEKYEVDIIEEVNLEGSTTAIDLMRIKLKDGNIKIHEMSIIEKVEFEIGEDTSSIGDTTSTDSTVLPLAFSITSDSTAEVSSFHTCHQHQNLDSISIPAEIQIEGKKYNVTSIGSSAFYKCPGLTSINIPEGVTSIGSSAFRECSSLTSINIPEGVTSIGSSAFYKCSSLTSINIPEGVTSIGSSTFEECRSLKSISIPEGLTNIGEHAFIFCRSLKSIDIPESVTSIGNYAFSGCSNLDVTIDNSEDNVEVGRNTFLGCKSATWLKEKD